MILIGLLICPVVRSLVVMAFAIPVEEEPLVITPEFVVTRDVVNSVESTMLKK